MSYLEETYAEPFSQWQASPTPQNMSSLMTSVQPVIERGLQLYAGKNVSPMTRSRARRLAIRAIKTYDPRQSKLSTHLTNHMQGLRRVVRQETQVMALPERVALNQGLLTETEQRLTDELGRPPSSQELTDATGLSLRRLAHIRKFRPPVAEGTLQAMTGEEGGEGLSPAVAQQPSQQWAELVYHDLDPTNQQILEHSLGLFGQPALSNQQLAGRLGLTPGAVTQRKAKIQRQLDQFSSEFASG